MRMRSWAHLEGVGQDGRLQLVRVVRGPLRPDPEIGVRSRPVILNTGEGNKMTIREERQE